MWSLEEKPSWRFAIVAHQHNNVNWSHSNAYTRERIIFRLSGEPGENLPQHLDIKNTQSKKSLWQLVGCLRSQRKWVDRVPGWGRGTPALPNVTEESWVTHPSDLAIEGLLVILTRPHWTEKGGEQRDTTCGDYSFKMFGQRYVNSRRKRGCEVQDT